MKTSDHAQIKTVPFNYKNITRKVIAKALKEMLEAVVID